MATVFSTRPLKLCGLCLAALTCGFAAAGKKREAEHPPAVEFAPGGGVFTNSVVVRLAPRVGSGVVRFTLDGSEPTAASPLATNGIVLTNCALVTAGVFRDGTPTGEPAVQGYTVLDSSLTNFSSNLPLVIISSPGREILRDRRVTASVRIVEAGGARSTLAGAADFDGFAHCNLRGRSSLRYPKRSFNLKTVDASGEPIKVPLLGLPKEWDWILYAPYPDKTLLRDVLAYELSNQMGRYATPTKFVEVFVSQTASRLTEHDYLGVYVLEEKIKSGKFRVNIDKLAPGDISEPAVTGGYIFKKDHVDRPNVNEVNIAGVPQGMGSSPSDRPGYPTGPGGFPADPAGFLPPYTGNGSTREVITSSRSSSRSDITNRLGVALPRADLALGNRRFYSGDDERLPSDLEGFRTATATNQLYFVEPEPDEINAVQRAWLAGYVNEFERVLSGPDFANPTNGYRAYIDPDSFIDHHLLVEVTKNVDGFRFSTFFHKDRRDVIGMGPAWDWNLSFGNANGKQGWLPEHWLWPQLDNREYSWFRRLFDDPDFGQKYVDRWAELRREVFATAKVLARIDELAKLLDEAQTRNFQRWPILGLNVNPNWYVGDTYREEIDWMKKWTATRLAWIEQQFLAQPVLTPRADATAASRSLNMEVKAGKVYYTLDGSDPRAPGGAVSAAAREYSGPVTLPPGAQVTARAKLDQRWSSPACTSVPAR